MRIESVTAQAFGPFVDQTLDLAEGLTVVVGDNESGKSSWHAAIFAALCGRKRGRGASTLLDRDFERRHRPWTGDKWEVSVRVILDDRRRVQVRQDLDGKVDCSATDLTIGTDISSEISRDGSPDASIWLGLDRASFRATAWISQAGLLDVRDSADGLQTFLQLAATAAVADTTAASAISLIDAFFKENVGLDRANATKPLRTAVDSLSAARAALAAAEAGHAEYVQHVAEADKAQTDASLARRTLRQYEAAEAQAEADRLEAQAQQAQDLHDATGGVQPAGVDGADVLDAQVDRALAVYDNRPAEPATASMTVAELDAEIAGLPTVPEGDLTPDASVASALEKVRRADVAVETHDRIRPQSPGSGVPDVDERDLLELARTLDTRVGPVPPELRARLEAASAAAGRTTNGRRIPLLVAAGIVAVLGAVLLAVGQPIVGAVAVAAAVGLGLAGLASKGGRTSAAVERELAQAEVALSSAEEAADRDARAHRAAIGRCAELGIEPDPYQLRRLAVVVAGVADAHAAAQKWATDAEALRSARADAYRALHDALLARGWSIDSSEPTALLVAVDAYTQTCADRSNLASSAARRPLLEAERAAAQRAEADVRTRDIAAETLMAAAAACDLTVDNEQSARDALVAWQRDRSTSRVATAAAINQWTRLQTLLGGRTLDDVVADARSARARADALTVDGLPAGIDPADVERRLPALREAATKAVGDARSATTRADESAKRIASVAEAEESVAAAEAKLASVQRLARTLDRTKEFLERAEDDVHRDIAPVLNSALNRALPDVTDGRYVEAAVNPADLSVTVFTADRRPRTADQLSFGTTEQVYLLLRAALADRLTAGHGSCPLILDDVTVHADAARKTAILELLHELSKDRQVIVFSQEQQVADWAHENLTTERDAIVELKPIAVA